MRRDGILLRAVARWGALAISLGTVVTVSGAQTVTTYAASGASKTVQTAAYIGTASMSGAGTGSFAAGSNDAVRRSDSANHPATASHDATRYFFTSSLIPSLECFGIISSHRK